MQQKTYINPVPNIPKVSLPVTEKSRPPRLSYTTRVTINPQKDTPSEPTPVELNINSQIAHEGETMLHDVDYFRMAKHLNIDLNEIGQYEDKIKTILQWGKEQSKSKDIADVLFHLKKIQRAMGAPETSETLLTQLYRWVVLDMDEKRIQQEKKLFR